MQYISMTISIRIVNIIKEKIFRNISSRAADLIKEDLEVMGPVRLSDVEKAQTEIVKVASPRARRRARRESKLNERRSACPSGHGRRNAGILGAGMERSPRPSFEPAGAGGLLVATTVVLLAIGALVGWALGSAGVGAVAGAAAGIPAGIFAVYRRYRGYFS